MPTREERIAGGLFGLLVGDALGVPYEFHDAADIPPLEQIEFEPPEGFRRAHGGVPPGTWSDDGAQALCLLASLLERGTFDANDFAEKLMSWNQYGYMAVDGELFDIGNQTMRALTNLASGVPPLEAGLSTERDNGNGSLMRVLPLALWHRGTDLELVADACAQSKVTHGHLRSQACCALYCLWARGLLEADEAAFEHAVESLRKLARVLVAEIDAHVLPVGPVRGSGYVVDSLRATRHVLPLGPYERVVKEAIRLGEDTDTTACIAGGLAGVRDGVEAIPQRWRDGLRGSDMPRRLLEQLLRG